MTLQQKKRIVTERDIFFGIQLDLLLVGGLKSRITSIREERQ
jgi:hypothetical protein